MHLVILLCSDWFATKTWEAFRAISTVLELHFAHTRALTNMSFKSAVLLDGWLKTGKLTRPVGHAISSTQDDDDTAVETLSEAPLQMASSGSGKSEHASAGAFSTPIMVPKHTPSPKAAKVKVSSSPAKPSNSTPSISMFLKRPPNQSTKEAGNLTRPSVINYAPALTTRSKYFAQKAEIAAEDDALNSEYSNSSPFLKLTRRRHPVLLSPTKVRFC
jgi:hypothetical protein